MTVDELEDFFRSVELPATVKLGPGETVTDVKKFVYGHIAAIRHNPTSRVAEPFHARLLKLKEILKNE